MAQEPFVGRDGELTSLAQLGVKPDHSDTGAVLIRGRAGVGKSRLLDAWLAQLPPETFVLRGGADTFDRGFPYSALDHALTALLCDPGRIDGSRAAVIAYRAMLRGRRADLGADPQGVATALLEMLATMPDRRAVIVLEDAHLADPDTLRVCAMLTRQTSARLLLAVSLRPGYPATEPLESFLGRLGERRRVTVLDLDPLSEADTGDLFTDLIGRRPPPALAARVAEWTGGNPFFIHEVAAQFTRAAEGREVQELTDWQPGPDPWLAGRLARLGSTEREVARILAISHRVDEARIELLPELLGLTADAVAEAVDQLIAQAVLVSAVTGGYTFGHELIKESFLEDLGPEHRRRLRGRLGEALLSRHADGADSDGYELAQLLAEARVAPDPAIVPILAAAAERAARSAPLVAAGWFAEARRFAEGTPQAAEFLVREIALLSLAGRRGSAWEAAAGGLADSEPGEVSIELVASGAAVALAAGQLDEVIRVSELLPPSSWPGLVRVTRATALLLQWQGAEGAAEYESMLAQYRADGDQSPATGLMLYSCARLLARSDDMRDLEPRIEESIGTDDNPLTQVTLLASLAEMSIHGPGGLRAPVHSDPRLSLERLATNDWPMVSEGGVQEGFYLESCYLHGEWETILDIVPVIGVLREHSLTNTLDLARLYSGAIHGARGDIEELRSMLAAQPTEPTPWLSGFVAAVRSRVLEADGQSDIAIDLLYELHERAERTGIVVQDAVVIDRLVSLLRDAGRLTEARPLAEACLARERRLDRPMYLGTALDAYGMAFADGDALREAKSIFLDQDMPFADARTSLELARLDDDPANNLADAYRIFGRLKVRPGRQLTMAEMRRRGIPLPRRRRRRTADDFSEVEQAIVELVVAGRTNGQIAKELSYSPKTVEMHLTRIYRRTKVGHRIGLVQAVASGRLRLSE